MTTQPELTPRIYNAHDFGHLFAREVQRATRYQDFLSLCLVLVRNDHSGRPTADVLDAVAHRLVELLRSTDLVGILEDTVAVLLVHTPGNDAAIIMDRLRGRAEAQAFRLGAGGSDLPPKFTLAFASFPTDATSDGSLLSHARARLAESPETRPRSPQPPGV